MSAAANKQILQNVFAEMAEGNTARFRDCLSDDISWSFKGSTKWTMTYRGKQAVLRELLGPIFAQFANQYTSTAERFVADEDLVVVETRGNVMTKSGRAYCNKYCYVCRMRDGKIIELTEYMDTALADAVLADPVTMNHATEPA
ncbi:MAG: nuclear transport factor 2 family protein [Betaproteobacteria bacterium]